MGNPNITRERQQQVYEAIAKHPGPIFRREIAEATGISGQRIQEYLTSLTGMLLVKPSSIKSNDTGKTRVYTYTLSDNARTHWEQGITNYWEVPHPMSKGLISKTLKVYKIEDMAS